MTDPPGGVPPPQKEAAAQAGTGAAGTGSKQNEQHKQFTTDPRDHFVKMALAVARDGELHEFLPKQPQWYRRIGGRALTYLAAQRVAAKMDTSAPVELYSLDRHRLEFVHRLALARRRGAEIGPAYPGVTHGSLPEARGALSVAFDDIVAETHTFHATNHRMAA